MGTIAKFPTHLAKPVLADITEKPTRTELMRTERQLIIRTTLPVGQSLLPECHMHTRKRIVVLDGCAALNLPTGARRLLEDEHTTIPVGTYHKLENHGKIPLVVLEIRTGITSVEDNIRSL